MPAFRPVTTGGSGGISGKSSGVLRAASTSAVWRSHTLLQTGSGGSGGGGSGSGIGIDVGTAGAAAAAARPPPVSAAGAAGGKNTGRMSPPAKRNKAE